MISGFRPVPGRYSATCRAYFGIARFHRTSKCAFHVDGRSRVSNFWIPTGGITKKPVQGEKEDANDLLIRGGFLRQAYSGIFHMLPLGLRVQDKLERLIDKHMRTVGASKVSLSSLSAQELWEQSGRLKEGSEIFRFQDRKESRFLLAPTHEEEITTLVGHLTKSYRDLPVRVYQISRKYRDEQRPRQGLLRGREFIMKDLYTFDYNAENALKTYTAVKKAYTELFDELKIPYLVAAADSGNMGGSLSHEFHFASNKGEDTVISCSSCDSVYNEELADGKAHNIDDQQVQVGHASGFDTGETSGESAKAVSVGLWMAISHDKNTLLRCWYPQYTLKDPSEPPAEREVNSHAVKSIAKAAGIDLDISIENPLEQWATHIQSEEGSSQRPRVLDVYDSYVRAYKRPPLTDTLDGINRAVEDIDFSKLDRFPGTNNYLNLVRVHEGDQCSKCGQGLTKTHKATELGHTFHLGTRYSDVLQASVVVDRAHLDAGDRSSSQKDQLVPMQMGCHGIGVSRMISAVADNLADSKGLNWPRAIAPYEVIVVPGKGLEEEAEKIYDALTSEPTTALDVILDDRDKQMGWKLGDADLIGYPVIVVVGKGWKKQRTLEVQCRRLEVREDVALEALPEFVGSLLEKL
ncbi:hypothetical protein ASPTUDRAFT_37553 [Aspergillus tubingensis CBS 134.48]|uniref:proline--tRNA ligase n=1 Tax=Aspergillus tubingensis (strain CBS 134.48) TaxID=767770 RepID=A0A1L9NNG9_ASPTC|nr:hypothetical protein ASPTUDRAFT_37553 [Aspergillus tubingensis CBS 134.48]